MATQHKGMLILMPQLRAELGGRSRQWVYTQLRCDPTFPKPVKTGPYSIAWLRAEVEEWVSNLPRVEQNGLSSIETRKMAQEARGGL